MNLLLLLSALLSALTGAVSGPRAVEAPQAVAQLSVTSAPIRAAAVAAGLRPAERWTMAARRTAMLLAPFALHPTVPVFAGRRRE